MERAEEIGYLQRGIVYVAGSNQHIFNQAAGIVADRIARSLEHHIGRETPFRHRITIRHDVCHFSLDIPIDIASIEVAKGVEGETWTQFIDVIELKYLPRLVKWFSDLSPPAQAAWALWRTLRYTLRAPWVWARRRLQKDGDAAVEGHLDKLNKAQTRFLGLVKLVSMGAIIYWLLVAAASMLSVNELFNLNSEAVKKWFTWIAPIAVGFALVRLALKDCVDTHVRRAIDDYSAGEYYANHRRFAAIPNALLDAVLYTKDQGYGKVDLMSFSLGAVLSADAIHPKDKRLWSRAPVVTNWITIGYPYDVIEWINPGYFRGRNEEVLTVTTWINVVVEDDFLASDFQQSPQRGIRLAQSGRVRSPDRNVFFKPERRKERSLLDWFIPFRRVANHSLYWDDQDARASTCFDKVVIEAGWADDLRSMLRR